MKYVYKPFIFIGTSISILFSSCELYNPAEPVPAYIHIDKIDLIKNPAGFPVSSGNTAGNEGSLSHKVTDAWVYIDDILQGCYELPATFPVIQEGSHKVTIMAGIKVNGIAATRASYPFYQPYTQIVDFQKYTTINLSPTVVYKTTATFDFIESFENVGLLIDTTSASDTTLQKIAFPAENVFEGTYSGIAYLDATGRRFFECASINKYSLPKNAEVYLEFNYKCNYPFTVSVFAYGSASTAQFAVLHFNPSEKWNKAYVNLKPIVSAASTAINYKVAIGAINNTGADSVAFLFDNIKLVH